MGIVPATKILADDAPGFYTEVFLGGEKCTPMPLGGIKGLFTLFSTIRQIPSFSKMLVPNHDMEIEEGENIEIQTTNFAKDVSRNLYFYFYLFIF